MHWTACLPCMTPAWKIFLPQMLRRGDPCFNLYEVIPLTILYLLIAIVMFGLLIAIHEFGHFLTAKLCGVKVNEFAIGMGPALFKRQKGETLYSLRAFPIGGYCAMEGEDEDTGDERALTAQPWWKKLIIMAAGAFMNFAIGVVLLAVVTSQVQVFQTNQITGVERDFPNHPEQFVQTGDRIVEVDGHTIYLRSDIDLFFSRTGGTVDLVVERDGERVELLDCPMAQVEQENGGVRMMLGITLGDVEEATLGAKLRYTWLQAVDDVRLVWYSLGELFRGAVGLRDLSGPVYIISMVGDIGEQGAQQAVKDHQAAWYGALMSILNFASFIAINLAVMNLLPIPALDGGRIFFVFVNGIFTALTKKRLDPKYEGYVHAAGMILLLGLMVVVALSDVWKLIAA